MKKKCLLSALVVLFMLSITSCSDRKSNDSEKSSLTVSVPDTSDRTNSFYDNTKVHELHVSAITIGGEVANPGPVGFEGLPMHSVIVKETELSGNGDTFIGAYRYDGYSLFDLLNRFVIDKKNRDEFEPIIDLYVEIENEQGEKVVVSWGEIYYPNHLHEIIIATRVSRIVPSKTKDLWPLPAGSKLIVGSDLITERNISSPSKITVRSWPKSLPVEKGMSPMFAPGINVFVNNRPVETLEDIPNGLQPITYHTIFYGRGRGIHSTQPFTGYLLKQMIDPFISFNKQNLRNSMIVIAAEDGYRSTFTFSEIMNRNDQSEVLMIYDPDDKDGGAFKLFPAADFFSDRAVKSVNSIYISQN